MVVLLFPIHYDRLTQNQLLSKNSTFSFDNTVFPRQNSKLENNFKIVKNENLNYYSLVNNPFFWATGDGNVPCVNIDQIKYIQKNLGYIPQLKGATLADGFYSKKVTNP